MSSYITLGIGLLILASGVCGALLVPACLDILWRLDIAHALLNGKTLYRDIIEVNPPLWFWAAIPAVYLSKLMGLGAYPVLIGLNFAGMALAAGVLFILAQKVLDRSGAAALALGFLAALCFVSVGDLGQREQSLLLATPLWITLIAVRIEGRSVSVSLAALVGLLCAYGFALKHYFVLLPLLAEVWLLWRLKRAWRPFRPETITLGLCAIAYAAIVLTLAPEFLSRMLDLVQTAYFGFGRWMGLSPFERQLRLLVLGAFALVPVVVTLVTRERRPVVLGLLMAILVTTGIALLQQKGWRYHFIASMGLSLMVMVFLCQQALARGLFNMASVASCLGLIVLAWMTLIHPALLTLRGHGQAVEPALQALVSREPQNSRIFILSTAPDRAYLPMARAGRTYWSRHYSMWMLPGLLTPTTTPEREKIRVRERSLVRAEFTADIMCAKPDLIVGEVGYFGPSQRRKLFNAMAFLREDSVFNAWMNAHYLQQEPAGRYPIWRLRNPTINAPSCEPPFKPL